jgi:hypothetical protein
MVAIFRLLADDHATFPGAAKRAVRSRPPAAAQSSDTTSFSQKHRKSDAVENENDNDTDN